MQFWGKIGKIICWHPLKGWRPLLRGILDPALMLYWLHINPLKDCLSPVIINCNTVTYKILHIVRSLSSSFGRLTSDGRREPETGASLQWLEQVWGWEVSDRDNSYLNETDFKLTVIQRDLSSVLCCCWSLPFVQEIFYELLLAS